MRHFVYRISHYCQLDDTPDLYISYMDLLISYVQVQLLLSSISERKQIIGVYALAFRVTHVSMEPTFAQLGLYVNEHTNTWKKLQRDFENVSPFLASMILSVSSSYSKGIGKIDRKNIEQYRDT